VAWIYEQVGASHSSPKVSQVAIVPLQDTTVSILTLQLDFEINQVLLTKEHVLIAEKIDYPANVHVYNSTNFEELKTFKVPSSSLLGFYVSEDSFIVRYSDDYVRTYNLETLEMEGKQFYHTSQFESTKDLYREGFVRRGMLYEDPQELQPLMMLEAGPFKLAAHSYSGLRNDWLFTIPLAVRYKPIYSFFEPNVYLQLEEKSEYNDVGRTLNLYLWIVSENGDVLRTVNAISGPRTDSHDGTLRSALAVGRENAYVAFRDTLYRFSSSNLQVSADSAQGPSEPHFVPGQTVFCTKRQARRNRTYPHCLWRRGTLGILSRR